MQQSTSQPHFDAPGRGRIYDSIIETIGNTPLVRAPRLSAEEGVVADLVLKLEFFNPLGSVKDRIGVSMILDLEKQGKIGPNSTLIEPTSGNTGIALAFVAAARGYRLILTMPESMSIERRKMLAYLGAELELTPREKGMKGAIARAEELLKRNPQLGHAEPVRQPGEPRDPPQDHRRGDLARYERRGRRDRVGHRHGRDVHGLRPSPETAASSIADGRRRAGAEPGALRRHAQPAPDPGHRGRVHSGGYGYLADRRDHHVENQPAIDMARKVARLDGIAVGISSGAAIWAAVQIGKRPEMAGKRIVTIVPSFAERYLSTVLFEGL